MALRFLELLHFEGRVGRRKYAVVGAILFAIKSIVDRVIGAYVLPEAPSWFLTYWAPLGKAARLGHLSSVESRYLLTMMLFVLPFIWIGVAMTVRRLRDAGQPVWLAILFFIPFLNLLLLLALCFLPSRQHEERLEAAPWPQVRSLDALIPRSQLGSALLGLLLLVFAIEGLICILMAAPIALVLAWLGGSLGYFIEGNYWGAKRGSAMLSVVLFAMPAMFGLEHAAGLAVPEYVVRTSIDVHARPEQVWKEVVAFAEIPAPQEMLFRAGIAYPIRAEISGHGVGAVRHCIFSTGAFVEPIEVWDEPRLLKFGVTANPPPLNELTPYGHIEPRHLHGYFVSEQGQFLLTPLPNGGTRLEGTTWYRNAMWPAAYWRLWSDAIIHLIHLRVLRHIR